MRPPTIWDPDERYSDHQFVLLRSSVASQDWSLAMLRPSIREDSVFRRDTEKVRLEKDL